MESKLKKYILRIFFEETVDHVRRSRQLPSLITLLQLPLIEVGNAMRAYCIHRKINDLNNSFFECALKINNLFPVLFEINYLFSVLFEINLFIFSTLQNNLKIILNNSP